MNKLKKNQILMIKLILLKIYKKNLNHGMHFSYAQAVKKNKKISLKAE